jgi:hypothetical protein
MTSVIGNKINSNKKKNINDLIENNKKIDKDEDIDLDKEE